MWCQGAQMLRINRRKVWLSLPVALTILAVAQNAVAQDSPHRIELFAEGGASMSNQVVGQQSIVSYTGPTLGASEAEVVHESLLTTGRLFTGLRFWLGPDQAIEASFSYAPTDLAEHNVCSPSCGESKEIRPLRAFFAAGNYVHELPSVWRARPFLTAGLGVAGFYQPIFMSFPNSRFVANFGGGFDFRLSRHWSFRAEYRDWMLSMPQVGDSTPGGMTHNSVPSAGLVYRF
jgi:hypothetical protein